MHEMRFPAGRSQQGFTLIELLVVVFILSVLTLVVVFALGNSRENTQLAACRTEKSAVELAIAAARTANLVNTSAEDPDSYLEPGNAEFYTWSGLSSGSWAPSALGTFTC